MSAGRWRSVRPAIVLASACALVAGLTSSAGNALATTAPPSAVSAAGAAARAAIPALPAVPGKAAVTSTIPPTGCPGLPRLACPTASTGSASGTTRHNTTGGTSPYPTW